MLLRGGPASCGCAGSAAGARSPAGAIVRGAAWRSR